MSKILAALSVLSAFSALLYGSFILISKTVPLESVDYILLGITFMIGGKVFISFTETSKDKSSDGNDSSQEQTLP
jgi:hypothetical protein